MAEGLVDALEVESEALAEAAGRLSLDAMVPTCPEWSVADLLAHAGLFTAQVGGQPWAGDNPNDVTADAVPAPLERVDWYRAVSRDCLSALRRSLAGDIDGVPAHLVDNPVGFARMLAREIPVHRWDMQNVVGDPAPIASVVAAEGLTAMFENFLPAIWRGAPASGTRVRLTANDVDVDWTIGFLEGGPTFEPGPPTAPPEVHVMGTSTDLLLLMFRRPGHAAVEGDPLALPRPWRTT